MLNVPHARTYVDVEPDVVFGADVGDVVQRVERAHHRRAGRRRDEEGARAAGQRLLDPRLQVRHEHHAPAAAAAQRYGSIGPAVGFMLLQS